MRYREFKKPRLRPYQVIVVLSDHASAKTIIYADSAENAWLIACEQYGRDKVLTVDSPNIPHSNKPVDTKSAIQFWADRLRRNKRLAGIPSKDHMLYRARQEKAYHQLQKLIATKT